ncbi:MAG TPA: proton-conducting transporter membrane subunit, partial [Steroidobacteraceae bacterium]|nr:proton-conducting transporter membrane subunit [Steroidobacteraceae bacterium]
MSASALLPLTVLLPLGVACALLVLAHWLPSQASNVLAIATAVAVCILCAWLARQALEGPVLHWFGGWSPRPGISSLAARSPQSVDVPGVVIGISLRADPANCVVSAFCALLFAASFVFAWGYFDTIHSHFQILMLFFLAALVGFCLTHDLFNLFVWFELMSIAAFAATAYPLGKSSLEGALNFTITNALASFMMLAGVGLLYARTGTLDFTLLASQAAGAASPVLTAGFGLIAMALLTKGAILPFNLWLADAHAVAPSPVSMIFSGAMVPVALFGLARLVLEVFAHCAPVSGLVHTLLPVLGSLTAAIGGVMAWAQRHLK